MTQREYKQFAAEVGMLAVTAYLADAPAQAEKWARLAAQTARAGIAPRPGTDGTNLA